MRGDDRQQQGLFSYVVPEAQIPSDHPLRAIRPMLDAVLPVEPFHGRILQAGIGD